MNDLRHLRKAILAHEKKIAAKKLLAVCPAALSAIIPSIPTTPSIAYATVFFEKIPYSEPKCIECGKTGHLTDKY